VRGFAVDCCLLLRSVGVGGDEVFEIQDGPGWLRPIAGGSMSRLLWRVLRESSRFGFQQQDTFETFWGMPVPVHDLAIS
jgi:hypothetical protein